MKLGRLFLLFIGAFLFVEIFFVAGSAYFLVWQEEKTDRQAMLRDFDRIFQGNSTEIVGNLMLGHLQLTIEQLRRLAERENISIDLTTGANTFREGQDPGPHGVAKEFSIEYAGKPYGVIRFARERRGYWERQWGLLAVLLAVQCLLFGIINYLPYRWSRRAIIEPLEELVRRARRGEIGTNTDDKRWVPHEVSTISTILSRLWVENQEKSREAAIGQISAQVAHDIRSPLMALKVASEDLSSLPETHRELLRGAINRIHDIATSLLKLRRGRGPVQAEHLAVVLHDLVQEKRLQYSLEAGVRIEMDVSPESYSFFSLVDKTGLQRLLSNLVNNAAEAPGTHRIRITLEAEGEGNAIRVHDDGAGIPEAILPQVMQPGGTFGKLEGTGLGLSSAKGLAESWGGSLRLESKVNEGTTVTLTLPRVAPPSWFVPALEVKASSPVISVDDDSHIHYLWKGRLKGIGSLQCFGEARAFRDWLLTKGKQSEALFLVDMEFAGESETGLRLITEMNLVSRAVLVTHRHDDKEIRTACEKLGLRLLPKSAAELVPIAWV